MYVSSSVPPLDNEDLPRETPLGSGLTVTVPIVKFGEENGPIRYISMGGRGAGGGWGSVLQATAFAVL